MKGIVLAGGTGSRLSPLTDVTNKHLLPIGMKPMIFYPIERLVKAGITDIMIITGTSHMGAMFDLLGSGARLNCQFTYRVQDTPDGIGGALKLCQDFVGTDSCLVILGDNIFTGDLTEHVNRYEKDIGTGCMLFLRKVSDPHRYGVATLDKDGKLVKITEKPKVPDSNLCITGVYIYDSNVFNIISDIRSSSRGELEVTDINNEYIKSGLTNFCILEGFWTDAGVPESYRFANEEMWDV